jgi:ribonuclease P protein component
MREEDVPAEQPQAEEDSRLPASDAHPRRARGDRPSPPQESLEPLGLIWRVRDRAMFRALARARRCQAGALVVSATEVTNSVEPPRVAYAVNRSVGNAVQRNRVRRRLRAATREHAALLRPGWGYLVRATPAAARVTYRELETALVTTLRAHRQERRS